MVDGSRVAAQGAPAEIAAGESAFVLRLGGDARAFVSAAEAQGARLLAPGGDPRRDGRHPRPRGVSARSTCSASRRRRTRSCSSSVRSPGPSPRSPSRPARRPRSWRPRTRPASPPLAVSRRPRPRQPGSLLAHAALDSGDRWPSSSDKAARTPFPRRCGPVPSTAGASASTPRSARRSGASPSRGFPTRSRVASAARSCTTWRSATACRSRPRRATSSPSRPGPTGRAGSWPRPCASSAPALAVRVLTSFGPDRLRLAAAQRAQHVPPRAPLRSLPRARRAPSAPSASTSRRRGACAWPSTAPSSAR